MWRALFLEESELGHTGGGAAAGAWSTTTIRSKPRRNGRACGRQYLRSAICATRSKGPAVPRPGWSGLGLMLCAPVPHTAARLVGVAGQGPRLLTQPAAGTVRSRRTRTTCKDRPSGASISRFAVAVSRLGFAVGTVSRSEIEWVVIHGRDAARFHWNLTAKQSHVGFRRC
jgi:hypothetical protein